MSSDAGNPLITRREALRKTVLFSSALLTARWARPAWAQAPVTRFPDDGLHLLAFGDYGSNGNRNQQAVAARMAAFARELGQPLHAMLALGDNFYGHMTPERFQPHFEEMYPIADFNCPFYACLGNHAYGPDYDSKQWREKAQMELDYAASRPESRWKLPNRWYSVELPNAENPLVKIIILDGSFFEGALTPREKLEQRRYLEAEVRKETKAPWRWMVSHYPLYTFTTTRSDNQRLIEEWGPYLRDYNFSLYLAGHDHNLQHLEVTGYSNSFVVSGAGGGGLYEVCKNDTDFTMEIHGFNHLHVTREQFTMQFIDSNGNRLHSFRRTPDGKVEILGPVGAGVG